MPQLSLIFAAVLLLGSPSLTHVLAQDCPLDLSWSNFTLASSICTDQNERAKCCRYINAIVAVSVAKFSNSTGQLGVPSELSDICLNSISATLASNGIPPNATEFCGLGPKVRVSYECVGMSSIFEILQSLHFDDVIRNCRMPLSLDSNCKRCLSSTLSYLRHLVGGQDNVTLNTCRNAAFVALANQGDNVSSISDVANCFFTVQGLSIFQGNSSTPFIPSLSPSSSPSSVAVSSPSPAPPSAEHIFSEPIKRLHHRRVYQIIWIPGIGIGIIGLAIILLIILIFLIRKKSKELKSEAPQAGNSANVISSANDCIRNEGKSTMFRRFSYREIKKATANFNLPIGTGSLGTTYKAQFNGGLIAAVKQLNINLAQSDQDFCQKMEFLGRLHHRHLVTLKGFCYTGHARFMIYEFMENGSLRDKLNSSGSTPLTWQTRIQIAIDVANALEYLHFYCDPALFHGDINSSSILLDNNFTAKVADFETVHSPKSAAVTSQSNCGIQRAVGYQDPEYAATQVMSEKSDIYSYGVLLLELITGKQAIHNDKSIVEWFREFMARSYWLPELVDPRLADSVDMEQLKVLVDVAKLCIQMEGSERPSIKKILRILHEKLDPLHIRFAKAVENEDAIQFSSDARELHSSSSTSRSFGTRSILFDRMSPQSPPNTIFSS